MKKENLGMLTVVVALCAVVGMLTFYLFSLIVAMHSFINTHMGKNYNVHIAE